MTDLLETEELLDSLHMSQLNSIFETKANVSPLPSFMSPHILLGESPRICAVLPKQYIYVTFLLLIKAYWDSK